MIENHTLSEWEFLELGLSTTLRDVVGCGREGFEFISRPVMAAVSEGEPRAGIRITDVLLRR